MNQKTFTFLLSLLFVCFVSSSWGKEPSQQTSGVVIVVALLGDVSMKDANENALSKRVSVGSIIPVGQYLMTAKGSNLSLLLSNGTVMTVQENSKIRIGTFVQEPFDSAGKKVSDLKEEPSISKVTIDLDLGSLVVKTKKLNKNSVLDINSPLGVAGIRGTEFQMGLQADGALQLDVTESTVAFTPPGGQPTMVSQGNGLDVSSTGALNVRPINPETAQNITNTNEAATEASNDVSLDTVADAMVEAESTSSGEDQSTENPMDDSENSGSQNEEVPPSTETPGTNTPQINVDEIMEQNSDAKQLRKTGKEALPLDELNQFNFNASDLEKFLSFPLDIQQKFLAMDYDSVVRLIGMDDFGKGEAVSLMNYNSQARQLILNLEDQPLLSLLAAKVDENLILETFTDENVKFAESSNLPIDPQSSALEEEILSLAEEMKVGGGNEILEEILVDSEDEWTAENLEVAEIANLLNRDVLVEPENLGEALVSQANALGNPSYFEVSSLFETLLNDKIVDGDNHLFLGGNTINIQPGEYKLPASPMSFGGIVIGATESLLLGGTYSFATDSEDNVRLVVMSGEELTMKDGSNFNSLLSEMIVTARSDILLGDVRMESAREIAVRSLRDIQILNTAIYAKERVRIAANRDLYADGLILSQSLPSLIMEATTIRLKNIDFPSVTQVQLNSLKGPIDGRYPNFGTSIPQAQQLGRVNFLQNIRSGGNLLMDRNSFDQYGGNIRIGKVP